MPRLADFVCIDLVEALLTGEEPPRGTAPGTVMRRVVNRSVHKGTPEAVIAVGDVDLYPPSYPPAACPATGRYLLHRAVREVAWVQGDPRMAKVQQYGFHSWTTLPVDARGTTLGMAAEESCHHLYRTWLLAGRVLATPGRGAICRVGGGARADDQRGGAARGHHRAGAAPAHACA